jgi:biopolymer transport protein ExbD
VDYQSVIHAMDNAVKVGFVDVGLTDPAGLAARPQM